MQSIAFSAWAEWVLQYRQHPPHLIELIPHRFQMHMEYSIPWQKLLPFRDSAIYKVFHSV